MNYNLLVAIWREAELGTRVTVKARWAVRAREILKRRVMIKSRDENVDGLRVTWRKSDFHTSRKSSPVPEWGAFDLVWQFLLELPQLSLVLWTWQWQPPPWMQQFSPFPVLSDCVEWNKDLSFKGHKGNDEMAGPHSEYWRHSDEVEDVTSPIQRSKPLCFLRHELFLPSCP